MTAYFFSTPDWSKNVVECFVLFKLGFSKFLIFLETLLTRKLYHFLKIVPYKYVYIEREEFVIYVLIFFFLSMYVCRLWFSVREYNIESKCKYRGSLKARRICLKLVFVKLVCPDVKCCRNDWNFFFCMKDTHNDENNFSNRHRIFSCH